MREEKKDKTNVELTSGVEKETKEWTTPHYTARAHDQHVEGGSSQGKPKDVASGLKSYNKGGS